MTCVPSLHMYYFVFLVRVFACARSCIRGGFSLSLVLHFFACLSVPSVRTSETLRCEELQNNRYKILIQRYVQKTVFCLDYCYLSITNVFQISWNVAKKKQQS